MCASIIIHADAYRLQSFYKLQHTYWDPHLDISKSFCST